MAAWNNYSPIKSYYGYINHERPEKLVGVTESAREQIATIIKVL